MANSLGVPRDVQKTVEESQTKILAQLTIQGIKNEDAAKQMGISQYQVRKLQEHEDFKAALKELSEELVRTAAHTWKGAMGKLIPKALSVLEKNLEAGKLDAVKVVIASLGLEKAESQASNGTLQVILPDFGKKEKDIEVSYGKKEEN